MTTSRTCRRLALAAVAGLVALLPACLTDGGHFTLLGYTTKPNYNTNYRTVRVPIFKNQTYWTVTPVPGMEMDLTRAVVRELELKTPYKVVQCDADTELVGRIVGFQKTLLNYTPFNTIREGETTLTVELVWRDLRTGEVLTRPARRPGQPLDPEERQPLLAPDSILPPGALPHAIPSAPGAPSSGVVAGGGVEEEILDPRTRKRAIPVVVRSTAHFRPELGESITTALQKNYDRMAVQIVSVLEEGW
jgi:hypothetical protein